MGEAKKVPEPVKSTGSCKHKKTKHEKKRRVTEERAKRESRK